RGAPALRLLEPRVCLPRIGRLPVRTRPVTGGELGHRVEKLLVRQPRTGHQDHARPVPGADEYMLDSGGAVKEVPRTKRPFLTVDEELALPRQHEEGLLLRLRVVQAVRLPGLQDGEVDAELRERELACLEAASRAERLRRPPLGVPHV